VTLVVGWTPDPSGHSAADLAAVLARSAGERLEVVTVVPAAWPVPSSARVDGEYRDWAAERGRAAAAEAEAYLAETAADVPARCTWAPARSAPAGLERAAAEHGADLVVIGSSTDGAHGQVVTGSTADRLLHSSPVPVALAPRGFRAGSLTTVGRVTCAYRDDPGSVEVLQRTARITAQVGARLRVATFGVRGRTMYPPEVATSTEDDVLAAWSEQASTAQRRALSALDGGPFDPAEVEAVVGVGRSWSQALDQVHWERGDVLVVGSSTGSALARVFLGSNATKIVRHSPVPVVVVPSGG
jgi:nucleotide-binding universal stress UspA family protein